MPSKKDPETTSIATSEAGLALQKLLLDNGAIDEAALAKLVADEGFRAAWSGLQEARYTRVGKSSEWATGDHELTKEEEAVIRQLPEVMGMAPSITDDDPRALTDEEVDLWAEEVIIERQVIDMLEGLKKRMRSTFINATAFLNDGDPLVGHEFKSPKNGYKIVVSKSGRAGDPDFSKLEGVVAPEVWEAITDEEVIVSRTVNEEKLNQAFKEGKISMQHFIELIPEKKEWPVVTPKVMKDGDIA